MFESYFTGLEAGETESSLTLPISPLPLPAVVFPQDLLEKGLEADNFAMLGLGDIVIPGNCWEWTVVEGWRRCLVCQSFSTNWEASLTYWE